ncbi:MAG: PDZ domain-containing protein [Gemmatimonadota bacterium]
MRRAGRGLAAGAACLALVTPSSETAGAQEAVPPVPFATWQTERPVLGVYLSERCESPRPRSRPCSRPPLITAVEAGGPADRAGVHPGDTLIAVDGKGLTTEAGRRALASLEAGHGVRLTLGRVEGGPRSLVVIPEVLKTRRATKRLRALAVGPGALDVQLVEVPRFSYRFPGGDSLRVVLDSLTTVAGEGAFVWGGGAVVYYVSGDGEGAGVRIEEWTPERVRVFVKGRAEEEAAAEARRHAGRQGGEEGGARTAAGGAGARTEFGPLGAYVWDNPDLARRLELIRDSVSRAVRVHLDSLHRIMAARGGQFRIRLDSVHAYYLKALREGTRGAVVASQRDPNARARLGPTRRIPPAEFEALFTMKARAAGAEFTPLTPGLAENFEGARKGLLVLRVLPGTPAARLGLRDGDVVVEAGGVQCSSVSVLREVLSRELMRQRGVEVKWIRKGRPMSGRVSGS